VCCARRQEIPTDTPTSAPENCDGYNVYFANYVQDFRVQKMTVIFDDVSGTVSLVPGSIAIVSRPGGGDDIVVNPQDSTQLFVGGQQERMFVIDTTNPNPMTNWWRQFTTGLNIFHVEVIDNNHVVGTNVEGAPWFSYHTIVGGTLADQTTAPILPITPPVSVVSIIRINNGIFAYTTSNEFGPPGDVGFLTITPAGATALPPIITGVPAHNGAYHVPSNTLIIWGAQTVSQYRLDGTLVSTTDATTLIGQVGSVGARHLDNGIIHQERWLLIASNAGKLVWYDIGASGRVDTALSGSFIVTDGDALDSITIPVCNRA